VNSILTSITYGMCARVQALLAEWRAELSRQPLALTEADACAVLGIKTAPGAMVTDDEMRKAYRYGQHSSIRTHTHSCMRASCLSSMCLCQYVCVCVCVCVCACVCVHAGPWLVSTIPIRTPRGGLCSLRSNRPMTGCRQGQ
jgi:hypothetical protein